MIFGVLTEPHKGTVNGTGFVSVVGEPERAHP